MATPIPLNLKSALHSLRSVPGFELLGDWQWHEETARFFMPCRLSIEAPSGGLVPPTTPWYVLVDRTYPWGLLKFCPAKDGGLTATFHHQEYNGVGVESRPWRNGGLCLNTTAHSLGRHGFDTEPFDASGPSGRLRWHAQRALDWLKAAAAGTLVTAGDPFEVPQFPGAADAKTTIAYSEGEASFDRWKSIHEQYGVLEMAPLLMNPSVLLVSRFFSGPQTPLIEVSWGKGLVNDHAAQRGIWLRLPTVAVLEPWQAPRTWQELCHACRRQHVVLDKVLMKLFRHIRDGSRHILLVGFPMPERFGGLNCRMHWQPLRLPILCQGEQSLPGFRPNREEVRYQQDKRQVLAGSCEIEWMQAENWELAQLGSRGRLPKGIADRHVLLIGGGALGSALAELFVRASVPRLSIMDGEDLEAGNLCRHTLTLADIKSNKAEGIARRLSQTGAHCDTDAISEVFPPSKAENILKVQACEIIIDCTGDDRLLYAMGRFPWGGNKRFISLSLGYAVRRLFCFVADGDTFPAREFQRVVQPWLRRERQEMCDVELPREGIGCWNPIFPARADDVWMMAAVAVKHIETALGVSPATPVLAVFEQQLARGAFVGVLQVPAEVPKDAERVLVRGPAIRDEAP